VKVEYLDDAAFSNRLLADQRQYRASTDREGVLLRAVGLLDPSVDVELAMEELLKAGVIGYYDPRKKELAVRGKHAGVQARHALVHELTHALQDQWFNIDTPHGDRWRRRDRFQGGPRRRRPKGGADVHRRPVGGGPRRDPA